MTTLKVKFRPSTVKDRPGSIIYLVTRHRIVRQITSEHKLYPNEWDANKSKPILKNDKRLLYLQQMNHKLSADIELLHRIIGKYESISCDYSSYDIVTEFEQSKKENTLFLFMENVIARLQQLKHTGTAKNYRAALTSFKRFRNDEDIVIESIDKTLLEDYQVYMQSLKLTPNSISFYFRILRAVYNRAVEQGITKDRKPFKTVFTGIEKTLKRAISINDIKRIRNIDLSEKPNLEFARDVFLFLFFCRGMSFIDAAYLKKTDIENGILSYRRHKTGQILHIKMLPQINDLIECISDNDSPYLLSIITTPGKEERKQYESTLHKVNKALKAIADITHIPVHLTTYVSRHAWATIAKSKNIPINVISDALGHESITTTQIYLASIDSSIIDQANEQIIKSL